MHYVRNSSGGMTPIIFKNASLIANKKQTSEVNPAIKSKKVPLSKAK